jgi:hypothetical protein
MLDPRWYSCLRMFLLGAFAAALLACAQVVTSTSHVAVAPSYAECPTGAEGCPCTAGGGCDPGLRCDYGICVGDAYDDGEYRFEMDLEMDLAPAPAPAAEPPRSRAMAPGGKASRGRVMRQTEAKFGKKTTAAQTPAVMAPEASVAPRPEPGVTLTPEHEPSDAAAELGGARQVIYTAVLHVSVFDRDAAAELAERLPQRYGGWIAARNDYQITLRIAADRLFEAIEELSALGVVLHKSLLAEDVTAEYVDLDSRIRVLEQIVEHLERLLALATSVEQALEIRVELNRVRIELEAARVRMRALAELIDFSTLTLILSARGVEAPPSSNDPFPWVDALGVEPTEYR